MNKFLTVLNHTFITNAKSKTFIITTVITILLVGIVFNLPGIISYFDEEKPDHIGIVDRSGEVYESLANYIKTYGDNTLILHSISSEESAKKEIADGNLNGYLVIDVAENTIFSTYKAPQVNDANMINKLEQGLNQIQFKIKASGLGLSVEQASQLFQRVMLEKVPLDKAAKTEEEIVQSTTLVYILLFAIYFGVLMYGNLVATEVAKEKSSRIMEILISSVNPISQMFGKILGIALLGIVQTIVFVGVGYLSMNFGSKKVDLGDMIVDFSNIPAKTIVFAIVFFILAYLLFASIAAMLGSLVSRVEDLQQSLTPLNLIIVAAFLIAMFGLNNSDSPIIIVTSYIPFFSPMIMFLRVGIANPPIWEILISIGILVLTIIGVAVLAAKVYRGGVLMYGKGSFFKNVKHALSINKKVNSSH